VDGFPVGTPRGFPTSISTAGLVHFVAGTLGFISLAVSCFFVAVGMSRRHVPWLARLSFLSGVVVVVGFFGGLALSSILPGTLGIWLSVVVGWAWLAIMSLHLYRVAPNPNCAPPSR
jgi:hypothetical protein